MGTFGTAQWWGEGGIFCHTYPAMMELGTAIPYLKKIQKILWITWHTPWNVLTSKFFSLEISKCCYVDKYRYRLHFDTQFLILLIFLAPWKIFLINMVIILMMSAKMTTPEFLKITVFWNKRYDAIILVNDASNKILSRDSNYIVDMFMWPKFGNYSTSIKEVMTSSVL